MIKHDCFAYKPEPERCTALNDLYCRYENCGFYKPGQKTIAVKPATGTNVKLTPEEVAFIRTNYIPRDPKYGLEGLAKMFGVTARAVQAVVLNLTWKEET